MYNSICKINQLQSPRRNALGRKDFNMKVRNMESPRTGRPVANQFIIEGDGKTIFQSYDSTIAVIDWNEKTVKIGNDWNYSTTTGKYRNMFFYDNDFSDINNTKGINQIMKKVDNDGFALVTNRLYDDILFTVTRL